MNIDAKKIDVRVRIMKSLAHPSRLMMVQALSEGKMCVCELTDMVGADISTVSKHLSLLKEAGIVDSHRDGVRIYYRIKTPCVLKIFDCIEALVDQ